MIRLVDLVAPYCIEHPLSLEIDVGQMVALIGPNGAGKSTLINSLTGALEPQQGTISLLETDLMSSSRRWIAQKMGILHQQEAKVHGFTVIEMVLMGRYPHKSPLKQAQLWLFWE